VSVPSAATTSTASPGPTAQSDTAALAFEDPAARYSVAQYTTSVASLRAGVPADPADVFHPTTAPRTGTSFPVALMLQGGLVGRDSYSEYARSIASYGLVVVVPDHERLLFGSAGLYAEQAQVLDAVAWIKAETARSASPVTGQLDSATLLLLGHSFGGATALSAIEGTCRLPFCIIAGTDYAAPPVELKGAALYGTNLSSPTGDDVPFINTRGVPVTFIQGSRDTATTTQETALTFDRMSGGPKAIVTIEGADHFGLVNPGAGGTGEQPLDQSISLTTAARWAAASLLSFTGDAAASAYLATGDANDPVVSVRSTP
jgi:predicted dienelactone hydrolase